MAANVDGIIPYCSPKTKAGETILATIDIFNQCVDLTNPDNLILSVNPGDMAAGQGLSMQAQRQMTPINTAAAVTEVANLYAGHPITFSFNIQAGAFSEKVDEIIEGDEYVDSVDRPGWKELRMADRTGQQVSTYSAIITYRSGGTVVAQDNIPNCEIMSNNQGGMVAGQIYNRTVELKAQPLGDVAGTRVIRMRKK